MAEVALELELCLGFQAAVPWGCFSLQHVLGCHQLHVLCCGIAAQHNSSRAPLTWNRIKFCCRVFKLCCDLCNDVIPKALVTVLLASTCQPGDSMSLCVSGP